MGCNFSRYGGDGNGNGVGIVSGRRTTDLKVHQDIEANLRRERQMMNKEIKLLLLGAGESGKSTVVKVSRIYRETFTPSERSAFREVVYTNTIQSMEVGNDLSFQAYGSERRDSGTLCPPQAVLHGFQQLSFDLPLELQESSSVILQLDQDDVHWQDGDLYPSVARAIETLWSHPAVQRVVALGQEYQLNDSAPYFFDAIGRIGRRGYVPSDQDILRTRVRSTGIVEERFTVRGYQLRVLDVGGQRSERKKWIHCFEDVKVLLFVVAISEYDQTLREDNEVNRITESRTLFESIVNSIWFRESCFVLLLNKCDLFESKFKSGTAPFSQAFPGYTGSDTDVSAAKEYLRKVFIGLDKRKNQQIYTHFSTATDTSQVKVVMAAVFDSVLNQTLQEVGLL
ncbi:BQ5605_C028g10574 [Microbotryum silenes-dioicae]|uniref:BQ5605_C028g10574 protein n=1 Tax=Microbotryum silenes-dioicae TaxID=796604 RepID=A0A2X0N4Y4_9BASI|nr:BQ5605_C028g10574 [Microbotryum silenes-dioicae]